MRIGDVSRATGVAPSTIRYYEASGLIPRPSRRNGIRDYDETIVHQLAIVRYARSAGIPIRSLAAIASIDEHQTRKTAWVQTARRGIADLDALITQASKEKARLEDLLSCGCEGDDAKCVIFGSTADA